MRGDQRPPRQESAAEGAAIAAFGGGTGLHSLLKGIKAFTSNITAIVAVSDDGGSSGILRKEFDMPPPGDMRNCLVALADEESLMAELFRYRFENSELGGHSFGNIFITALAEVTGDFGKAIQLANKILSVRGRVLPATLDKVSLEAVHDDDSKTTGETRISKSGKRIRRLNLRPSPGRPTPQALEAVRRADILLFGPGSLFTSILPPMLNEGMVEEIAASPAKEIYVCNIMTQPGETDGFSAADHVQAIYDNTAEDIFDYIVLNSRNPSQAVLARYAEEGAGPVPLDPDRLERWKACLVIEDLIGADAYARHDPEKLARTVMRILKDRTER
ncbi:MAG: hypothetical protein DRP79_02520 [Planctomycetota bacterium]|nr:MAG: hypothetical protein DRP79_02520 [Planctomycetota bacterium]